MASEVTPQGIEAGTGETARLDPQDESPVAESDAPDHPTDYRNRCERAEAECKELRGKLRAVELDLRRIRDLAAEVGIEVHKSLNGS